MQRYVVFKFNASIILIICVKSMLYNIYLFFSYVFEPKTTVFMAINIVIDYFLHLSRCLMSGIIDLFLLKGQ